MFKTKLVLSLQGVAYKDVTPRIIAEPLLIDEKLGELRDYKFMCFNGEVKFFKIDFDRYTKHRSVHFLSDGSVAPFTGVYQDGSNIPDVPDEYHKMIELTEKLAKDIPFVRVDFYLVNTHIYFGEMTFYPNAGYGNLQPIEWCNIIGTWLELPNVFKIILCEN